jgi:hypothetical protein
MRAAGLPVRGRGRPAAISPEVSTDSQSDAAISPSEVSTDFRPARAPSASACEPYRALIAAALSRGRNAVAIYQDLVDDHGFTAKYASVRRFILTLRATLPAEARVVITTAPGEEGQVITAATGRWSGTRSPANASGRASSY